MTTVPVAPSRDYTEVPHIVRCAVILGVIEAVSVAAFSILTRVLSGPIELVVEAIIVILGVGAVIVLPGLWTRARTIEGIAGAAGIGLAATGIFLLIDVAILQPLGMYRNRWAEIGGGSNWWYHPVWWMVGTFLSWIGGWALANQTARAGAPNAGVVLGGTFVLAAIIMAVAKVAGVPGAAFGVGTFAVSILPALVLMAAVTGLGARRS
jgi:hypothetical protein